MLIRKTVLILFIFLTLVVAVQAQHQALSKIDTVDLKAHLSFIASDHLQGRSLGTAVNGLEITANYLANNALKMGLLPAAENYFQQVPLFYTPLNKQSFVKVSNEKGKLVYQSHELVKIDRNSGIYSFAEETVVFAGFGENIETYDLKNKLVVVAQGNAESYFKNQSFAWENRKERSKISLILEQEPKAMLILTNPNDKDNKTFAQIQRWFNRPAYSLELPKKEQPPAVLLSTPKVADALLGKKGAYAKYLKNVARGEKTLVEVEGKLSLSAGEAPEQIDAKNVVAYIEGSDPVLKDEYIVFMAHYDHIGMDKNGEVFNGADDNGSGTVAIMEVAEAFSSLHEKPKRSIVFLWVTCEEIGHLGSRYYCNNPVFPLEKTVAAINLDMVGRVYRGQRDDVWKNSPKKVKDFDGLYTLSNNIWPQLATINAEKCAELKLVPDTSLPKDPFLRASDHYHFHKNGVPVLNYATGYHADYHKIGDEVEKINFEKIKRVADLCFLVGFKIANLEDIGCQSINSNSKK